MDTEALEQALIGLEPQCCRKAFADRAAVEVPVTALESFMRRLHDDPRLAFDMLLDHTAIDHCEENRFELIYLLYSTSHGHGLMVTCSIERNNPIAPTVAGIWPIAHWQEREVFDLFGIGYDGHPDLRRIFLEDDWQGHPLRKDYRDADMLEFGR
jgi:NADH-quinone oxidoreductase subunit C